MIKDLSFDLLNVLNKIEIDKYGRVSAFLAINKPKGITSHDLVDQVRKKLGTRQVGHVGALDPNAEGVMLILVGKKYTQLSNDLMTLDKAYQLTIGFGLTTDSLDLEGKLIESQELLTFDFDKAKEIINSFDGEYMQDVPVFSSVKVGGQKLRVLARKYLNFKIFETENKKQIRFFDETHEDLLIDLPSKIVKIYDIQIKDEGYKDVTLINQNDKYKHVPYITLEVGCSKGTYVRQLAYDIAKKYGTSGLLLDLARTRIGSIKIENCIDITEVKYSKN